MQVSDLIVEVRDADLNRVGQILATDLVGFTGVLRFRKVGTWEIPLRYDNPLADELRAPGAGIIVTGPSGVLFSGPTTSATRAQSQDDPIGTWTIKGVTDEVVLGERLAYPTPTTADVAAQVDEQDVRSGVASTVMYGFVNANIGPSAPIARKIPALTLAADPAVGSAVVGRARFENLGKLLTRLAQIDGLGFGIKQDGSDLVFSVYEPTDRSASIRMDIDNNVLTKSEYTYTAPTATRAIVAGGGAGTSRAFAEVTTDDSETAETAWGRRIELFKDKRQTSDPDELLQAGTEELAGKGKTLEAISVSPSDDSTMAFGVDWELGDKVSVVAGLTTISQVVTEVGISIQEDGVRIGATVGEPSVADEDSATSDVQQDQEVRIANLEVNATEGGSGSTPADGSITTAMLTDGAVTSVKLADNAVTSAKIVDGTIVNADINASAAIAPSKISGTAVITTDSRLSDSRTPSGSAGGDLTGTYPNPTLAVKPGLVCITPSSVAVGSGTGTVNADGSVTFTTVGTYLELRGVFSSTYRNYRIIFEKTAASATGAVHMQMVTSANVVAATAYDSQYVYGAITGSATSTASLGGTINGANWIMDTTSTGNATLGTKEITVLKPFETAPTQVIYFAHQNTSNTGGAFMSGGGYHQTSASYTAFRLLYASGTMTGKVRVYGFN